MARGDDLAELLRLDAEVQRRQQAWRDNPPPAGYWRHEGYYGCGAINHGSTNDCACGYTMLRTAPEVLN